MIRLMMLRKMAVNARLCEIGDLIEADGELADRLLHKGITVCADPEEANLWRSLQPRTMPWVSEWRSK